MQKIRSTRSPSTPLPAPPAVREAAALRPLVVFVAAALSIGGILMTLSTVVTPGEPFVLAAVLLALALPGVLLTHREAGAAGVRALLRDCVRPPTSWAWLPIAAFGLPTLAWGAAAVLGGAQRPAWSLLAAYSLDVLVGLLVINLWEEMAWTGFLQRRATARWGVLGGSLLTAVFFTGIHLPLALAGAQDAGQAGSNVLLLAGVAVGLRVLIGRVDPWSGGSLLTVGLLHASFNATETVLEPGYDWVRIAMTVAAAVALVAVTGRAPRAAGR